MKHASSYKKIWNQIKNSNVLQEEDTAVFFYSLTGLKENLDFLKTTFGNKQNILHTVAIKTNPHPAILRFIGDLDCGLEAASYEEVLMALDAGVPAQKISYNSPVKTQRELNLCCEKHPGIFINTNSFEELKRIPLNAPINLGLRINPCVDLKTDDRYNVSKKNSKFGVPIIEEERILQAILKHHIKVLHLHVGSQVENTKEMVKAIKMVYELAEKANDQLKANGKAHRVSCINIGGGIASGTTQEENRRNMKTYVTAIWKEIPKLKSYHIITEFGQWTHRLNGICFSRIEYVKEFKEENNIAYIHLGGDLFPREIYTKTDHFSYAVIKKNKTNKGSIKTKYDIAGPLCFNGDYLIKNIKLPVLEEGDIFVIEHTGANTFGLWSRHCSRTIPKFLSWEQSKEKMIELSPRTLIDKEMEPS